MTGKALVRRADSILWELRRAWAVGKRISLILTDNAGQRVEGHVSAVSPTGASVTVNGSLIPTETILGCSTRHRWMDEDTTWEQGEPFNGRERRIVPQREELPGISEVCP